MKTKVIKLRSGERLVLYMSESTGKWTSDKDLASDNFYKYVITGKGKQARTIKQYYYECTVDWTKTKIKEMINEDTSGIEKAYNMVVDLLIYRTYK